MVTDLFTGKLRNLPQTNSLKYLIQSVCYITCQLSDVNQLNSLKNLTHCVYFNHWQTLETTQNGLIKIANTENNVLITGKLPNLPQMKSIKYLTSYV